MNKKVVYTAIFGEYDTLHEPSHIPDGWDFICFSDRPRQTKHWRVRVVSPTFNDPTRDARKYKLLPHRYLGSYEVSVWVDGNIKVHGNPDTYVATYLQGVHMAVFDHADTRHRDRDETPNTQRSVQEQLQHLLGMAQRGRVKDAPELMRRQVEHYLAEGFPDTEGILMSCVLFRRHNEPDVVSAMELWWKELKRWSKRDQLSFNYVAWKSGLQFVYIHENVRNSGFSVTMPHKK